MMNNIHERSRCSKQRMFHCNLFLITLMIIIMFMVPCSSNANSNFNPRNQIHQQSRSTFNLEQQPQQGNNDGHFQPMTSSTKPQQQPFRSQQQQQHQQLRTQNNNHHRGSSSGFHHNNQANNANEKPLPATHNQFGASNDQIQIYGNTNPPNQHHLALPSEFDVPLIVASGAGGESGSGSNNQLAASNIIYDQSPLALQSIANGQEQLVNSFYVGGFGTQPMVGGPQILNTNGINIGVAPPQQPYPAGADIYGTAAQQNYYSSPEQGPYVNYDGGGPMQGPYDPNMRPPAAGPMQQSRGRSRGPGDRDEDRYSDTSEPVRSKNGGGGGGGRKRMLSNDQLMSLIDELKEFNSKEASRMSNLAIQPDGGAGGKSDADSDDADDRDNDADGAVPVKKIETSIEAKKFAASNDDDNGKESDGGGGKSTTKGDDADLANIAKFLLTKEGANIRFQLGLDDGDGDDDDEKDQLLESKTRQLTSKNLKADNGGLSVATNRKDPGKGAPSVQRRQNEDKDESFGEPRDSESYDRARKRRDHHNVARRPLPAIELKKLDSISDDTRFNSNYNGPKSNNYAKLLIKSELLNDKLESAQDTFNTRKSPSSAIRRVGMPSSPAVRIVAAPTMPRKHFLPKHNFEGLDMTPKKGELGQRREKYSKDERDHDKEVMLDKLEQVREAKAKMRSRLPLPMMVPMVKRALNGEMRMRADKSPSGDHLLLRNSMDGIMRFKLPQTKKYNGNNFDKRQPITTSGSSIDKNIIIDNGRLNDSAPIPALVEPEMGHRSGRASIKIQSERPLKDEYPISDRVSDRLNKLSNSLDRYFNDGFLQEIESKAKLEDGSKTDHKDETSGSDNAKGDGGGGGNGDTHKAEPSNHNELSSPTANNRVKDKVGSPSSSLPKKDHDFDINVSVDGKRDAPDTRDPEDDLDKKIDGGDRDDDEEEEADNDNDDNDDGESGKAAPGKRTKAKGDPQRGNKKINDRALKRGKPGGANKDSNKRKRKLKKTNGNKKVKPVAKPIGKNDGDLEFENLNKLIDNMDPVENETLDTPIGPDSDSKSSGGVKVSKVSRGDPKNSSESSIYSKKTSFYQEPD